MRRCAYCGAWYNFDVQKIQKFFAGFLAVALLLPSVVSADLDPVFRENFSPWVEELCHAGIEYELDDRVWDLREKEGIDEETKEIIWGDVIEEGKSTEYHRLMNCLFNDAMAVSTEEIKELVEKNHKSELPQLQLFEMSPEQEEKCVDPEEGTKLELEFIIELQRHDTFDPENDSRCKGNEVVETSFSACRVQEVALRELCAYQQFLLAKSRDFESFPEEDRLGLKVLQDAQYWQTDRAVAIIDEAERAEETTQAMFFLYKNFVQKYRQHAWLVAVQQQVWSARAKLHRLKDAIETFADKFCNAAIEG